MSFKMMFDAGHAGKYNQSPLVPEYWESDMTWKLQTLIVEEFKNYKDVVVDITRPDQNTDLDIFERGCKAKGYDYFESLHSNATGNAKTLTEGDKNEKVNRVDIYAPLDKRNDSHDLCKKLATEIAKLMGVSSGNVKTKEYPDKPGVEYYGVLRGAQSVGVPMYLLTEHSFHTNIKAAKWLLKEENLKKLAKLKVEILADWFGLEKKESSTTNESVKPETKPEEPKKEEVTFKWNIGDIVEFTGNTHYTSANAASGIKCKPGKAKVTSRYNGKHKYHLVAEKNGGSNVYGWVDEAYIKAVNSNTTSTTESDKISVGDKVKVKSGVTKYSNGVTMKSWVRDVILYVRSIEKNGTVYLVSTQKTGNAYTGRVNASDVYKVK